MTVKFVGSKMAKLRKTSFHLGKYYHASIKLKGRFWRLNSALHEIP